MGITCGHPDGVRTSFWRAPFWKTVRRRVAVEKLFRRDENVFCNSVKKMISLYNSLCRDILVFSIFGFFRLESRIFLLKSIDFLKNHEKSMILVKKSWFWLKKIEKSKKQECHYIKNHLKKSFFFTELLKNFSSRRNNFSTAFRRYAVFVDRLSMKFDEIIEIWRKSWNLRISMEFNDPNSGRTPLQVASSVFPARKRGFPKCFKKHGWCFPNFQGVCYQYRVVQNHRYHQNSQNHRFWSLR